jgi:hypothetical protein
MPIITAAPTPGVHYLSAAEGKEWKSKIEKAAARAATPLRFCIATGDDMPIPLEVIRDERGIVIIHFFRRPDIAPERGEIVVMMALTEVLGQAPEGAELFYRDEKEIQKMNEWPRPLLEADSWYVEFPLSRSMIMPDNEYLKSSLALAVKKAFLSV